MKNVDFLMRGVSHYVCDTCTSFQESDLLMRTALVSHILLLLCPRKKEIENWKSVLCSMSVAFWQFHYVNSWGLFLHALSFNVNKGSWHIWKIKGIFSTMLFYDFFFYYFSSGPWPYILRYATFNFIYYTLLSPCAYVMDRMLNWGFYKAFP